MKKILFIIAFVFSLVNSGYAQLITVSPIGPINLCDTCTTYTFHSAGCNTQVGCGPYWYLNERNGRDHYNASGSSLKLFDIKDTTLLHAECWCVDGSGGFVSNYVVINKQPLIKITPNGYVSLCDTCSSATFIAGGICSNSAPSLIKWYKNGILDGEGYSHTYFNLNDYNTIIYAEFNYRNIKLYRSESIEINKPGLRGWEKIGSFEIEHISFNGQNVLVGTPRYTWIQEDSLMFSTNNGMNFKKLLCGIPDSLSKIYIQGLSINGNRMIIEYKRLIGNEKSYHISPDSLFSSTNNGISWELINIPEEYYFYGIYNDSLYASRRDSIALTTNYGKSWSKYPVNLNFKFLGIFENTILASDSLNIFYSIDGGMNWKFMFEVPKIIDFWNFKKKGNFIVVKINSDEGIFYSTDNGLSWKNNKINFINALIINMDISENKIFISTNDSLYMFNINTNAWKNIGDVNRYFGINDTYILASVMIHYKPYYIIYKDHKSKQKA